MNSDKISYRDLEIWKKAQDIIKEIHSLSLSLPNFEQYEEGAQIRRSSKSISANIVEGFGRRDYKNDFIRFLCYAQASTDETKDHLEILYITGSLKDKGNYNNLKTDLEILSKMIYRFIQAVKRNHKSQ